MKPENPLKQIDELLANPDTSVEELRACLEHLTTLYEKQKRQQNRLVKLSDANEAKLTKANGSLSALTSNLSRFIPTTVVKALMEDGQEQLLKLKRQELTVFFSDVVGFTAMSERLEPEQLAKLMADYFTKMSAICETWGGTLDQFIGDAIVIFFGAPESHGTKQDALNAASMALEMQQAVIELRHEWASQGHVSDFQVRMGLSTGYCNVGNFGAADRLHYTALGNIVNEAARIQAVGAAGEILLSPDTFAMIHHDFNCATYRTVQLKGKAHPLALYQLLEEQNQWQTQLIHHKETGFEMHIDPSLVEDKDSLVKQLKSALAKIDGHKE